MKIKVKRIDPAAILPTKAKPGDAGWDLYYLGQPMNLWRGESYVLRTGVAVEIPPGYVGLVCPRSGLAAKNGVGITNAPGVIDSGYRGEVLVILDSAFGQVLRINPGMRIAQLVVVPCPLMDLVEVESLEESERGGSGLGSTGF